MVKLESLKDYMRAEIWTAIVIICLELAQNVIFDADFPRNAEAALTSVKGTFFTRQSIGANAFVSRLKKTDDICNALLEAAAIPWNNLDDLCLQLTHITNN